MINEKLAMMKFVTKVLVILDVLALPVIYSKAINIIFTL